MHALCAKRDERERERASRSPPPILPEAILITPPLPPSSHMLTHPPTPPIEGGQEIPPLSTPPAHSSHASVSKGGRLRHNTVQEGEEEGTCVRTRTTYMHTKGGGPGPTYVSKELGGRRTGGLKGGCLLRGGRGLCTLPSSSSSGFGRWSWIGNRDLPGRSGAGGG